MIRVTAPHFVAGVVFVENRVVDCPPIVRYMIGWPLDKVMGFCKYMGWSTEQLL